MLNEYRSLRYEAAEKNTFATNKKVSQSSWDLRETWPRRVFHGAVKSNREHRNEPSTIRTQSSAKVARRTETKSMVIRYSRALRVLRSPLSFSPLVTEPVALWCEYRVRRYRYALSLPVIRPRYQRSSSFVMPVDRRYPAGAQKSAEYAIRACMCTSTSRIDRVDSAATRDYTLLEGVARFQSSDYRDF